MESRPARSSGSKILPTLAASGALDRDEAGRVVQVHRRTLLQQWTKDYSFFIGNGVVLDFLAPRGVGHVLDRLSSRDGVALTGAFAAASYRDRDAVPVVPPGLLTMYAAPPRSLAEDPIRDPRFRWPPRLSCWQISCLSRGARPSSPNRSWTRWQRSTPAGGRNDPSGTRVRAVDAVDAHCSSLVLIGAQAVYEHTGVGTLRTPPTTTDADDH